MVRASEEQNVRLSASPRSWETLEAAAASDGVGLDADEQLSSVDVMLMFGSRRETFAQTALWCVYAGAETFQSSDRDQRKSRYTGVVPATTPPPARRHSAGAPTNRERSREGVPSR